MAERAAAKAAQVELSNSAARIAMLQKMRAASRRIPWCCYALAPVFVRLACV